MKIHVKPSLRLRKYTVLEVSHPLMDSGIEGRDIREFVLSDTVEGLDKGGRVVLFDAKGDPHEFEAVVQGDAVLLFDLRAIADALREAYRFVWDFHYGLVFLTEDGRIITCNHTFYQHSGFGPEDVEGKKAWDVFGRWAREAFESLVDGRDYDGEFAGVTFRLKARTLDLHGRKVLEVLVRTTEEERRRNFERVFGTLNYPVVVVRGGKVVYLNERARMAFGTEDLDLEGGDAFTIKVSGKEYAVLRIPGMEETYLFFDVSEQREMISTLKKEILSFREMVEKFADVIIIVSSDATVTFVNPAIRNLGYNPDEVVGRKFYEFLPPQQMGNIMEDFKRFLTTGEFLRRDVQITTKKGDIRWVDVVGSVLRKNGDLEVLVVLRDVTEKVKLQKKLQESEKLYRTLVENSLAAVFVIRDDRIVYCNSEFEEFTGYSKEEWSRMDAFIAFDRAGVGEQARDAVRRALNGEVVRAIAKYITRTGEKRYAEFVLAPIEYGGKKAVFGNAVDITDIKMSELQLRKMNLLLSVANNVNRILSRSGLLSLEKIRTEIEKIGVKVGIVLSVLGTEVVTCSEDVDMEKVAEIAERCKSSILEDRNWVAIPITAEDKVYGVLVAFTVPDIETLETLKALAGDLGLAVRNAEMEEIRKTALNIIIENLNHFDTLADRLRNPLAVIKGFMELRKELGDEIVFKKVAEHADRIEKILDELRTQEIVTYRMLKILKK